MITKTIYKKYETGHESQEFKNLLAKLQVTGFSISRKNDWAYEVKRGKNVVGYINGNTSEFIEFIPVRYEVMEFTSSFIHIAYQEGELRESRIYIENSTTPIIINRFKQIASVFNSLIIIRERNYIVLTLEEYAKTSYFINGKGKKMSMHDLVGNTIYKFGEMPNISEYGNGSVELSWRSYWVGLEKRIVIDENLQIESRGAYD